MFLRSALPADHLSADSKDVIKVAMGLIGTMTALVLGLLIASAKDSYDAKSHELNDLSANLVLLDRGLAHYGPETEPIRDLLHRTVVRILDQTWSKGSNRNSQQDPAAAGGEGMYDQIQALSPKGDAQRSLQSQALAISLDIGRTRWLMFEQGTNSVATPFLVVLGSWLVLLFISFGLFAPRNPTVIGALLVGAASVSSAILLILEMYKPFEGLIQISATPLRAALAHLGGQ